MTLLDEIEASEHNETVPEMRKRLERERVHRICDDIRRQMGWRPKHDNDRSES